jgi:SOS response regulatory protein OraA/RecX
VARASKRDNRRAAPKPPPDGYELALKLLALRPHSTVELGRKLRQRGCSGAAVEEALERARARGYLDDEAFARAQRRGFAGNVIREALDGSLDDLGGPESE